jgi:hypothetical protein
VAEVKASEIEALHEVGGEGGGGLAVGGFSASDSSRLDRG